MEYKYQRPVAIDLFCGAGGFSCGIEQAGFNVALAIDKDAIHCATYKYNNPHSKILNADIAKLTGEQIKRLVPVPIDLVIGSPPCQGFSIMGHRNIEDTRNQSIYDFRRLIDEIKPLYFLIENVPGMCQGYYKQGFHEYLDSFKLLGYNISFNVFKCELFGIPQKRRRLFILGIHHRAKNVSLPCPPYKIYSVQDAIQDLPDAGSFKCLWNTDSVSTELKPPSPYSKELRQPQQHLNFPRIFDPNLLTSSKLTNHHKQTIARFKQTIQGEKEPVSRLIKLDPDGFSPTLRAGTPALNGSHTAPRPIHYDYPRCITVREAARIHSFPDWYRFHITKWHGFRQVGNSVPPKIAYYLGREISQVIAPYIKPPENYIALGNTKLLRFTQTQAIKYF